MDKKKKHLLFAKDLEIQHVFNVVSQMYENEKLMTKDAKNPINKQSPEYESMVAVESGISCASEMRITFVIEGNISERIIPTETKTPEAKIVKAILL